MDKIRKSLIDYPQWVRDAVDQIIGDLDDRRGLHITDQVDNGILFEIKLSFAEIIFKNYETCN